MKLKDILVEKIDLSKPSLVNFQGKQWMPISGDKVGSGAQARVTSAGLGMVTKIAVLDDELGINDPAVKFLDVVLEHQDNPFFPKIYHARVYRDKEGLLDPILIVQMEKLMPIHHEKIADATSHLYAQLGIERDVERGEEYEDLPDNQERVIAQANTILSLARNPGQHKLKHLIKNSTNPKFKEAMNILLPLMDKFGPDLHHGNWMVRLTSAGPQLVIIDPFTSSTYVNKFASSAS